MLKGLPRGTIEKPIPTYELLEFLWASDVDKQVLGDVFEALERHSIRSGASSNGPIEVKVRSHADPDINGHSDKCIKTTR